MMTVKNEVVTRLEITVLLNIRRTEIAVLLVEVPAQIEMKSSGVCITG